MAADRAGDLGIPLAQLADDHGRAEQGLPTNWSHSNPIDIAGDATPERYRDAILTVTRDPTSTARWSCSPQAMTNPLAVAKAIIEVADKLNRSLICCWMGEEQVAEARQLLGGFRHPGLPHAGNRDRALPPFLKYYRNQKLLLQTPGTDPAARRPETEGAKMLIEALLAERRKVLSKWNRRPSCALPVPVAQTMVARTATEALLLAEQIGFPVAMKVDSPDLPTNRCRRRAPEHRQCAGRAQRLPRHHRHRAEAPPGCQDQWRLDRTLPVAPERPRTDDRRFPRPDFRAGDHLRRRRLRRRNLLRPLGRPAAAQPLPGQDLIDSTRASQILGQFHNMPPVDREAIKEVLLCISGNGLRTAVDSGARPQPADRR